MVTVMATIMLHFQWPGLTAAQQTTPHVTYILRFSDLSKILSQLTNVLLIKLCPHASDAVVFITIERNFISIIQRN